ncbi:MAG: FecR domain-containing protein [Bacteroidales bacterium]|nr:FecR domain-containing protein [Bacteroidales bacterium]MDT8373347.1 FecR domain-containing protein [Bacteroidales bacterium]
MSEQDWADAAAWLSGENTADEEAARILINEDNDIMKKWDDLKNIDDEIIDVDKAWEKLNRRIETDSPVITLNGMSFMHSFVRIAATVIIVTGLGWLFFKVAGPEKITVSSGSDEKNIEVLLSDGSKAYLNRDSRLTYPENFRGDSRTVSLAGEAFFDIAPDSSRPFIIDAGNASVKVVGTSFSVMTDNGNNEVEVYVESGSVMLSSKDGEQNVTLEPQFVGRISDRGSSQAVNTDANYLSWHTDMLIFDGERLETVFADLKRTFNINIVAADPVINDYRLTSPFVDQPHDTIIKVICTTFNLHSVREEGVYRLYPGQVR